MKIDAALNFVVPLYHDEADANPYAYVYIKPISVGAFEANYRLLVRTFRRMMEEGGAANRFARLYVQDAATEIAGDGAGKDYAAPLLNEIGRISTAIVGGPAGWQPIPLQQAIDGGLLDTDDGTEAISAAVFFTAIWHISPKQIRAGLLESGTQTWGAETSSLPPMGWIASLPTSTAIDSTGETAPAPGTIRIQGA